MEAGISITLPGGLLVGGRRRRDAELRPLDGCLEERVSAAMPGIENLHAAVSDILCAALLSIGGEAVSPEHVASLTMADRQWIMLNLARELHGGGYWLKGLCDDCGQPFDMFLDPIRLPVKNAGDGFPFAELDLGDDRLRLRIPTGADQERIAGLEAEEAFAALMSACLLSVNGKPVPAGYIDALDAEAVKKIDDALDDVSPYIGTTIDTACPECKRPQRMEINPYLSAAAGHEALFQEVHMLASEYHWSERDILSLSRKRRRLYISLIESGRNV